MKRNIFNSIRVGKVRRNAFDLSHEKKLSMSFDILYPIFLSEVIPGDKFRCNTEQVIRFAPMVAPIMHRVSAYVHFFFVPNRLIWDNWPNFITGGVDGLNTNQLPGVSITEAKKQYFTQGSMADYFGIKPVPSGTTVTNGVGLCALPFRAYQQIYNDYYRDQTLQTEIPFEKGDTVTDYDVCTLRKRCWAKDYFTASLPWTQRGTDINIPIDPVYRPQSLVNDNTGAPLQGSTTLGQTNGGLEATMGGTPAQIENIESLGATINDLRTSIRLQEWLEKNARAGSRYIEQILAHFGVRTPDYRLQRSEYLGGGKTNIQISEVLANFGNAEIPQGNMAGHGIGVGNASGFSRSFNEHGWIIGLMSILPVANYQDGIPRQFLKGTKFDFAFPEFAHLGEQPVYSQELYHDYVSPNSKAVFGYNPRYAEYKYIPNSVHGDFRTTLDFWHLGRKFSAEPLLNSSFVQAQTDEDRIFAVDDSGATNKIYVQLYNNVQAIRPLPVYGTPML